MLMWDRVDDKIFSRLVGVVVSEEMFAPEWKSPVEI